MDCDQNKDDSKESKRNKLKELLLKPKPVFDPSM